MSTIAKELYNTISLPATAKEKKKRLLKVTNKLKSLSNEKILEYRQKINDIVFMQIAIETLGERLANKIFSKNA